MGLSSYRAIVDVMNARFEGTFFKLNFLAVVHASSEREVGVPMSSSDQYVSHVGCDSEFNVPCITMKMYRELTIMSAV